MIKVNKDDIIVYQSNSRKYKAQVCYESQTVPNFFYVRKWSNARKGFTGSFIRITTMICGNDIIENKTTGDQ